MSHDNSDVILQRMMALHPKVIDLTLDRVWRLLHRLGNPQNDLPPVIHIAGTNGKGSTQAMLRAGLEAAGKRVHAYTSPHLARFHERIRLAGTLITEDALTAVLDECYTANGSDPITYFEITTVAGILAMARTPADYTLLEVGLGGRLDATNVIEKPELCIITPISIDHEAFLGDTLAKIAAEKAGIIKKGVPCIVGPQPDEALDVIEARAASLHAPLIRHGQEWHYTTEHDMRMIFQDDSGLLDLPLPALPGAHQLQNAGMAIAGLRALGIDDGAYDAALTNAYWPARMQRLSSGPLADAHKGELWLDGGHNPAAGEAIATHLARLPKRPTYLICGMLNTKDISGYLRPLAAQADGLWGVSIPGESNTLSAQETVAQATSVGMNAYAAHSVEGALKEIVQINPQARVLICGSLYLAGNILRQNG